jgi:hypothetical protein
VTASLIPEYLKNRWNKTPTPITFIGAVNMYQAISQTNEAKVCDGVA